MTKRNHGLIVPQLLIWGRAGWVQAEMGRVYRCLRNCPAIPTWWGSSDHSQGPGPACSAFSRLPPCRKPVRLPLASALVTAANTAERLVTLQNFFCCTEHRLLPSAGRVHYLTLSWSSPCSAMPRPLHLPSRVRSPSAHWTLG